jgi:hypothetical protein
MVLGEGGAGWGGDPGREGHWAQLGRPAGVTGVLMIMGGLVTPGARGTGRSSDGPRACLVC